MSDTVPPVIPPIQPPPVMAPAPVSTLGDLMIWGAIVLSALTSVAFTSALILAFVKGDQNNLNLLIGAVIANFSNVVTYWLGGSADSKAATRALTAHVLRNPNIP